MAQSVAGEFRDMPNMSTSNKVRLALLKLYSVNNGLTDAEKEELKTLKEEERKIK